MFWRAQRSRSPPRLTSTIPQMEQHLAAMDTSLRESPVEKVDPSAVAQKDIPAGSLSPHDQTATTGVTSNDNAVPDMGERQASSLENDANPTSTGHKKKMIPKSETIRVKAQHAGPRLLTLIACASYLLFHLMGINLGLRTIQGYTEPRLHHAKFELKNTVKAFADDCILHVRLTNLLDTSLTRSYMDSTYEDCLLRGLHSANTFYHGLNFTSDSRVRNETADWVADSCDRLLYTPQVYSARASMLRARANSIRHAMSDAFKKIRYRLELLQRRLGGGNLHLGAKLAVMESVNDTSKVHRVLPDMPYGFGLECEDKTRCRLVYSGSVTPTQSRKSLWGAMTYAGEEVYKWSWEFEKIYRIVGCIFTPLAILQPLLVLFYLLASMITLHRPQYSEPKPSFTAMRALAWKRVCYTAANLRHDQRHTLGLIIHTALYALLGFQLKYIIAEFDRVLLPIGFGFCVFHTALLAAFIDRPREGHPDPTLGIACRAIYQLCLLCRGVEDVQEWFSKPRRTHNMRTRKPVAYQTAKPASKIATRFISPLTPVCEDLQQERKAMHAEQGKAPRDDVEPEYGYATETDEDYDSEAERSTYVDLTGGTPMVSDEDDLVLVEG